MEEPMGNPYFALQRTVQSLECEKTVSDIASEADVDMETTQRFLDYLYSMGAVVRSDSVPVEYYPNTREFFIRDVCERVIEKSVVELEQEVFDESQLPPEHTMNFARVLFQQAQRGSGQFGEMVRGAGEKMHEARNQLVNEMALSVHYQFEMQQSAPPAAVAD